MPSAACLTTLHFRGKLTLLYRAARSIRAEVRERIHKWCENLPTSQSLPETTFLLPEQIVSYAAGVAELSRAVNAFATYAFKATHVKLVRAVEFHADTPSAGLASWQILLNRDFSSSIPRLRRTHTASGFPALLSFRSTFAGIQPVLPFRSSCWAVTTLVRFRGWSNSPTPSLRVDPGRPRSSLCSPIKV